MSGPTTGDPPAPDGQCWHGVHRMLDRETDPDGTVHERRRCLRCRVRRGRAPALAVVGEAWGASGPALSSCLSVLAVEVAGEVAAYRRGSHAGACRLRRGRDVRLTAGKVRRLTNGG